MDAGKLQGLSVVSIVEAARLGPITDIVFDTDPLRVAALRGGTESNAFIVPFEQVRKVGKDAVTVHTSEATQVEGVGSATSSLPSLKSLQTLKVVDESGTFFGVIQGVEIDPTTGAVIELTAHKGGVLGVGGETATIDAEDIRTVGAEVVTVAEQT